MLAAFNRFISENNLCSKDDRILIAVSGGIDSAVLLDLFHDAGYSIGIAHCNFKLRGDESDLDEEFVKNLSEEYKTDFHLKVCDASKYAIQNKSSIQESARELRYQWFEEVSKSEGYDKIAVAQHADDQIETFFINLLRGTGVAGLKGIPYKRGKIIRPLLFANKNDIENYAKDNNLSFREDSSNSSDKYLRNQIRHQLLPQLENINENYRTSIGKSLQYLAEDHQMVEQFVSHFKNDLFIVEDELIKIDIERLLKLNNIQTLLFYLLKNYGFNRDNTNLIYKSVRNKQIGNMFNTDNYQLLVDRNFLILKKKEYKSADEIFYIKSTDEIIETPVSLQLKIIDNIDKGQIKSDPIIAYFDLNKINFPLTIRKWKIGDRFIPFGMKGSKLISDYLVDQKIDRFKKESIYVIESDGKIAWLIGYRVSNEFRITNKTKQSIVMQLNI